MKTESEIVAKKGILLKLNWHKLSCITKIFLITNLTMLEIQQCIHGFDIRMLFHLEIEFTF